ncbi:MAG: putative toxin-antitoxin system toxin component, PIN family [Gemmataceae bacterium]|nr:putative toxin-antitoxin system toxin component, PIN family [Gemmataceae bacterium]
MRVVVDTNVLVRAHARSGGSGRALLAALNGPEHVLVLSPFILSEVERVLNYPRLQARWPLTPDEIHAFVTELAGIAEVVQPALERIPDVLAGDPDDDPIVATAVLGKADVLCTLDKHFHKPDVIAYCAGHGFKVLKDVELVQLLRELEKPHTSGK